MNLKYMLIANIKKLTNADNFLAFAVMFIEADWY